MSAQVIQFKPLEQQPAARQRRVRQQVHANSNPGKAVYYVEDYNPAIDWMAATYDWWLFWFK